MENSIGCSRFGKELQETGLYDYGWRQYMPDIGRWNAMDQLAEMYAPVSPYAYVANNPVSFTDPDGRAIDPVYGTDENGNKIIVGWTFTGDDATAVGGYLKYGGDYGSLVSQLDGYGSNFGSGPLSSFWRSFNSNGLNMKFVSTSSAGRSYFGANGVSHLATTVIDVSVMPFDDWVKSLGGNTESGFDWDKLNGNMGAFGLGNEIKTTLIDIAGEYGELTKTTYKYLKFSKRLGVVGNAATIAYSGYKVYNQYQEGGANEVFQHRDILDTAVGAVGLVATGVVYFGLTTNPIGWGIIGVGALVYGGATLIYDHYNP